MILTSMENLKICYGSNNITLNKGDQHIVLTEGEAAYLVESVFRNISLKVTAR